MSFRDRVFERARRRQARIVLPEGGDARVRAAADRLTVERLGTVEVMVDVARDPRREASATWLQGRHPGHFRDIAAAHRALDDPLTFAACLVARGLADVMVAGAVHRTSDVVRTALFVVGPAPGFDTVSGALYLARDDRVLTFTDAAVVPEPTPDQLAQSALAAARDRRRIVGDTPVVAFLSYSTKGSAAGPRVARVREAVAHLERHHPDFVFDGELQGDAALVEAVAHRKAPDSPVRGHANVLVFPDLDSGNIAYKLVQRLGGWTAVGPLLQGLARPIADLSRGATADDIVDTAAAAILQGDAHESGEAIR